MARTLDALYIHPGRCVSDYNIPAGLIGLMNSLSCAKRGIMYFEMTEDLIARSAVIVMDCHWYYSLAEVGKLAKKIKRINRQAKIVVGGYTASVLAEDMVEQFLVDYVIKGDAEKVFPFLIDELLKGRDGRDVPNVVHKQFVTPQSYCTTSDDLSACDYITIDWFPLLERRMAAVHRSLPFARQESLGFYPLIPVYKGCRYHCDFCYAKESVQQKLYHRGFVIRKPESVVGDLIRCSRHPYIDTVYFIADFMNMVGSEFAHKIFSRKYDLNLYYEFEHFNSPPTAMLHKMIDCFKECYFGFVCGEPFTTDLTQRIQYLSEVLAFFRGTSKNINAAIYYGGSERSQRACRELQGEYKGLSLLPYQQWFIPIPELQAGSTTRRRRYFDFWKRKAEKEGADQFFARSSQEDEDRFQLLLADKLLKRKSYREALRCCRKVPENGRHRDLVCLYSSKAYYGLNRYAEAIVSATRVRRRNWEVYFLLGLCHQKHKRYQEAIQEYQKAEEMNPNEIMISAALLRCRKRLARVFEPEGSLKSK